MQLFWFAVAIAAYFAVHSLLAAEGVKAKLSRLLPVRVYRLFFNVFSILALAPLVFFYLKMEKQLLLTPSPWLWGTGGLLAVGAGLWLLKSLLGYDLAEFSGLYQWKHSRQPTHTLLRITGLNAIVRHPLYFGTLLLAWSFFLLWPTDAVLIIALVISIYIFVGTWLEERKLTQQFGEAYRSYRREVPMLFPFGRRHRS